MDYLSSLNPEQRKAVEYGFGPVLILAGAGSGKTRVLTHRIAHLIHHYKVHPSEILAVTFTNKAAAEMRHRVVDLLSHLLADPPNSDQLWVSTFHSLCVRILRSEIHRLDYSKSFSIYDDGDQLSVIKASLRELKIGDSSVSPKAIQSRINRLKNDGMDLEDYQPAYGGFFEDAFIRVFERYRDVLKQSSALDFGDLLLKTVQLFRRFPDVLEQYQNRFPFLLIDEYQDTNRCQYIWMKLLASKNQNVCAVGDEDQSIYGWRGADISNILGFERDFPNAQIFKLQENYRSTKNIIEAASHVISFNTERRDKELFTQNPEGDRISLIECYDDHDEAIKVVNEISQRVQTGESLNQISVFYRTNAQSRLLEDMLRSKGLNYQIFGGLKFYDRLEVKDALAFLKLIANPEDDVSFRRIVNVPARGVGAVSLERFSEAARKSGKSLYPFLLDWIGGSAGQLDVGRAKKGLMSFFQLMTELSDLKARLLPSDLLGQVLEMSGYRKALADENTVESVSKLENLAELRNSIVDYELRVGADRPDETITLEGFLEQIALVSDLDRFDPSAPAVKLMTIHMAKGLEFDCVFIVGLEEELFPNIRAWESEDVADVEEERRLFYVGMTRARKKLYLLFAKNRTVFGVSQFRVMSRFIEEVPTKYIEERRADYFSRRRPYIERPGLPDESINNWDRDAADNFNQEIPDSAFEEGSDEAGLRSGSRVMHPLFGEGVVRRSLGRDKLIVEFAGRGLKKISLKFTQLKPL